MRTIKILTAVLTVFFMTACGDDYLELTPPDAIADTEAFETLEDFQVGLNGIYASIRAGGSYWGKNMMMNYAVSTDDFYAVQGFTNQWGSQYAWTVLPGTAEGANLWLSAYQVNTRASNLINNFGNLPTPASDEPGLLAEQNQILGEAKLARAMAHFDLVRVFAKPYRLANPANDPGVPIVTVENLEEKARNTIGEVYTFILEEALEARDLITMNRERHFMGVDAANAFLARVYHEMGDWPNAITYATNVINARDLSTGNEFLNIWATDGGDGDEVIFMVGVHQSEFGNALNLGSNFVGGNPPSGGNWRIDYIPGLELVGMYDKDNDIRYAAYFLDNVNVPTIDPVTAFVKYPPDNPNFTNRGMNQMKVFRVAEAYLIRAEAYAESGQAGPANDDLEALRLARISGYSHTDLSGDNLLNAIYDERRKEMVGESSRWFDLKRRNLGFARTPQQGTGPDNDLVITNNDHRWVWPIPQGEMDANSLMVQNPGYASDN